MMGHDGKCTICGGYSSEDRPALDGPEPKDKLCPACRKAVRDAREQRDALAKQQKVG